MNKDFFDTFHEQPPRSSIRIVSRSNGVLYSQPDEVLSLATKYYEALFTLDASSPNVHATCEEVWPQVSATFTAHRSASLLHPFMNIELHAIVVALDTSSCLGSDGLTC